MNVGCNTICKAENHKQPKCTLQGGGKMNYGSSVGRNAPQSLKKKKEADFCALSKTSQDENFIKKGPEQYECYPIHE